VQGKEMHGNGRRQEHANDAYLIGTLMHVKNNITTTQKVVITYIILQNYK
jgi:hypothetical protein